MSLDIHAHLNALEWNLPLLKCMQRTEACSERFFSDFALTRQEHFFKFTHITIIIWLFSCFISFCFNLFHFNLLCRNVDFSQRKQMVFIWVFISNFNSVLFEFKGEVTSCWFGMFWCYWFNLNAFHFMAYFHIMTAGTGLDIPH